MKIWMTLVLTLGCTPKATEPTDSSDAAIESDSPVVDDTDRVEDTAPPIVAEPDRVTSEPIVCADPSPRDEARFDRIEVGADWDFHPTYHEGAAEMAGGWGVAVADFNGDGHLDLLVPRLEDSKIMLGDGAGGFVDDTARAFPGEALHDAVAASVADVEGDGDMDAVLLRDRSANLLLRNDGTGVFEYESLDGAVEYEGCGCVGSWADADLDNRLDLFLGRVARSPGQDQFIDCPSSLLMQNPDGTFRDEWEGLSDDVHAAIVFGAGWMNIDADPEPELYVVSDRGRIVGGNRLLDNDGGVLTQLLDSPLHLTTSGMGLGIGDLNSDGVWDMLVPALNKNFMLVSDVGSRSWFDSAPVLGLLPDLDRDQASGWGGEICDINNDARLDVLMNYGTVRLKNGEVVEARHAEVQPDEVYLGQPDGTFRPVGQLWSLDDGFATRGSVVADLNRDGYLDIVKREYGGIVVVYLSRCGDQAWLEVELDWATPNRYGVGAEIIVESEGVLHRRLVNAGSTSTVSGGPPFAHFGLAQASTVDRLRVIWPDGVHEVFTDDLTIDTRAVVHIRRD